MNVKWQKTRCGNYLGSSNDDTQIPIHMIYLTYKYINEKDLVIDNSCHITGYL